MASAERSAAQPAERLDQVGRGALELVLDLLDGLVGLDLVAVEIGSSGGGRERTEERDADRGNRGPFNRSLAGQGFTLTEQRLDRAARGVQPAYKGRLLTYVRHG